MKIGFGHGALKGIEVWELNKVFGDFLHERDLVLHLIHIDLVNYVPKGFCHGQAYFEDSDESIEPGADGDPPLLRFAQAIAIADLVWTWRMLADEIDLVFLADPVLQVEAFALAQG